MIYWCPDSVSFWNWWNNHLSMQLKFDFFRSNAILLMQVNIWGITWQVFLCEKVWQSWWIICDASNFTSWVPCIFRLKQSIYKTFLTRCSQEATKKKYIVNIVCEHNSYNEVWVFINLKHTYHQMIKSSGMHWLHIVNQQNQRVTI